MSKTTLPPKDNDTSRSPRMTMSSTLTKQQERTLEYRNIDTEEYGPCDFIVKLRYDDACGNGHNTFAMTGSIYAAGRKHTDGSLVVSGGISDDIAEYIPELAHLAKWHLCSTDGPMHYIANTIYHARDRDHPGVPIGAPVKWEPRLKLGDIPFTFKEHSDGFWAYLDLVSGRETDHGQDRSRWLNVIVEPVVYDGDGTYVYRPRYTLSGFRSKGWTGAPFRTEREATEFLTALREHDYAFIDSPIKGCKAEEVNIEAARRAAIWPDATIEQLTDEAALMERLPALMVAFKSDMEELGFVY